MTVKQQEDIQPETWFLIHLSIVDFNVSPFKKIIYSYGKQKYALCLHLFWLIDRPCALRISRCILGTDRTAYAIGPTMESNGKSMKWIDHHVECWWLLLDVVQTTRVGFQDGRVMEHLVKRNAQENDVELGRDGESEREWERTGTLFHFKQKHLVASGAASRLDSARLTTLPNRAQNLAVVGATRPSGRRWDGTSTDF